MLENSNQKPSTFLQRVIFAIILTYFWNIYEMVAITVVIAAKGNISVADPEFLRGHQLQRWV